MVLTNDIEHSWWWVIMRHDITQPKKVWVDTGSTTTWIARRRNLPKLFKSAPHPDTRLNLMWHVLYFMNIGDRNLKRWRNIMEEFTFGIQMSSRNTWSNSLDHHDIFSYWATKVWFRSVTWQVCIVIPVSSPELITLSARPLGDPTEEEVVNLILWIFVTLGNCGVVCPTSTLVNQRIAKKKSHFVCSNVSYRIQQLTLWS